MKIPNTLTFDGSKGFDPEICPLCDRLVWLGVGEEGQKICQRCHMEAYNEL